MVRRILSLTVLFTFFVNSVLGSNCAFAQGVFLPAPGTMVETSPAYVPLIFQGLTVHADNPLLFDFVLDTGDSGLTPGTADDAAIKEESQKLIKYFLASLTLPEKDQWVNLSPYEKDRVLPEELGKTDLGRDMLAQDYVLKQITASMINPDKDLGKAFWARVYERARKEYGTTDIPVDTFNKVWIKADKANVYISRQASNAKQGEMTAFVVGSHLKVMLESDYLAEQKAQGTGHRAQDGVDVSGASEAKDISKQIIREIILPELEKEVNEGKNFANLRQIFHSMILATWYKKNLKDALLTQVYADHKKTGGVEGAWAIEKGADVDPEQIWTKYVDAYKKGVFNFIREDVDKVTGEVLPHKYFSGGMTEMAMANLVDRKDPDTAEFVLSSTKKPFVRIRTRAERVHGKAADEGSLSYRLRQFNRTLRSLSRHHKWPDLGKIEELRGKKSEALSILHLSHSGEYAMKSDSSSSSSFRALEKRKRELVETRRELLRQEDPNSSKIQTIEKRIEALSRVMGSESAMSAYFNMTEAEVRDAGPEVFLSVLKSTGTAPGSMDTKFFNSVIYGNNSTALVRDELAKLPSGSLVLYQTPDGEFFRDATVGPGDASFVKFYRTKSMEVPVVVVVNRTPESAMSGENPQKRRVVIVDDEVQLRGLLAQLVQLLFPGFEVEAVDYADAQRALATAEIAVLDWDNKGAGPQGREVVEMAYQLKIPYIMSTGNDTVKQNLHEAGRDPVALIQKPYEMADLKRAIFEAALLTHPRVIVNGTSAVGQVTDVTRAGDGSVVSVSVVMDGSGALKVYSADELGFFESAMGFVSVQQPGFTESNIYAKGTVDGKDFGRFVSVKMTKEGKLLASEKNAGTWSLYSFETKPRSFAAAEQEFADKGIEFQPLLAKLIEEGFVSKDQTVSPGFNGFDRKATSASLMMSGGARSAGAPVTPDFKNWFLYQPISESEFGEDKGSFYIQKLLEKGLIEKFPSVRGVALKKRLDEVKEAIKTVERFDDRDRQIIMAALAKSLRHEGRYSTEAAADEIFRWIEGRLHSYQDAKYYVFGQVLIIKDGNKILARKIDGASLDLLPVSVFSASALKDYPVTLADAPAMLKDGSLADLRASITGISDINVVSRDGKVIAFIHMPSGDFTVMDIKDACDKVLDNQEILPPQEVLAHGKSGKLYLRSFNSFISVKISAQAGVSPQLLIGGNPVYQFTTTSQDPRAVMVSIAGQAVFIRDGDKVLVRKYDPVAKQLLSVPLIKSSELEGASEFGFDETQDTWVAADPLWADYKGSVTGATEFFLHFSEDGQVFAAFARPSGSGVSYSNISAIYPSVFAESAMVQVSTNIHGLVNEEAYISADEQKEKRRLIEEKAVSLRLAEAGSDLSKAISGFILYGGDLVDMLKTIKNPYPDNPRYVAATLLRIMLTANDQNIVFDRIIEAVLQKGMDAHAALKGPFNTTRGKFDQNPKADQSNIQPAITAWGYGEDMLPALVEYFNAQAEIMNSALATLKSEGDTIPYYGLEHKQAETLETFRVTVQQLRALEKEVAAEPSEDKQQMVVELRAKEHRLSEDLKLLKRLRERFDPKVDTIKTFSGIQGISGGESVVSFLRQGTPDLVALTQRLNRDVSRAKSGDNPTYAAMVLLALAAEYHYDLGDDVFETIMGVFRGDLDEVKVAESLAEQHKLSPVFFLDLFQSMKNKIGAVGATLARMPKMPAVAAAKVVAPVEKKEAPPLAPVPAVAPPAPVAEVKPVAAGTSVDLTVEGAAPVIANSTHPEYLDNFKILIRKLWGITHDQVREDMILKALTETPQAQGWDSRLLPPSSLAPRKDNEPSGSYIKKLEEDWKLRVALFAAMFAFARLPLVEKMVKGQTVPVVGPVVSLPSPELAGKVRARLLEPGSQERFEGVSDMSLNQLYIKQFAKIPFDVFHKKIRDAFGEFQDKTITATAPAASKATPAAPAAKTVTRNASASIVIPADASKDKKFEVLYGEFFKGLPEDVVKVLVNYVSAQELSASDVANVKEKLSGKDALLPVRLAVLRAMYQANFEDAAKMEYMARRLTTWVNSFKSSADFPSKESSDKKIAAGTPFISAAFPAGNSLAPVALKNYFSPGLESAMGQQAANGGIDLNANNMSLEQKGDATDFAFDPSVLAQFKSGDFSGITPVILNIMPIQGLGVLLGADIPAGK